LRARCLFHWWLYLVLLWNLRRRLHYGFLFRRLVFFLHFFLDFLLLLERRITLLLLLGRFGHIGGVVQEIPFFLVFLLNSWLLLFWLGHMELTLDFLLDFFAYFEWLIVLFGCFQHIIQQLRVFVLQSLDSEDTLADMRPFIGTFSKLFQSLDTELETFARVLFESVSDAAQRNHERHTINQFGVDQCTE